jgi:hypothetical protein
MRLTLRTMLAYLDEILEPEDHQDIGRKIEESEFATSLVHRIRDVSRRMRLAAPKVSGRGMGLDPNTVAEYLDNTLAGERVPDFEKVCLESDVHLAEVASCHQILALVQVQPAEVDPDLRNRMYEMASRADEPAARERNHAGPPALPAFAGAPDGSSGQDEPARPVRPRPEVPDYLRSGSRSKFVPIAVTVLLAVCLLGAIVWASGPLDKTNALYKLVFGSEAAPDIAQPKNTGKPEPAASSTSSSGTNEKPGDHARQPAVPADKTGPRTNIQAPGTAEQASGIQPSKPAGSDAVKGTTDSGKSGLASPEVPAAVGPGPADDKRAPVPPLPDDIAKPAVPLAPGHPNDAPNESPAVPAFPADVRRPSTDVIGRLTSSADQEVLLRMVAGDGEWHRVGPAATFNTGEKLLVLPTFHPTVTLAAGITLQLVPETLIEFEGIDHGIPVVRVYYGRMVVMTTGKADVTLKLALGETSGILAFVDAEATVGVEVRPFHLPGEDPERNQSRLAIALYGINGDVSWNAAGELNSEKLHSPARLVLAADPTQPVTDRDVPKWTGAEPVSPLDVRASQDLNAALSEKRPVTQALLELSEHRKAENKSLAARSLALIDEFDPFDNLLNDREERSVWPIQIESLRAAVARGPAVAAKVRASFERQRGKDGADLYRMLWGYGKDDLAGGAAAKLVELLDSDNMDLRVLSFYNLRTITGATFNYRPEQSAASRQVPVRTWKDRLKEGLIGPKVPPAGKVPASEPAVKTPAEPLPRRPAGEPAPSKVPPPPTPDSP